MTHPVIAFERVSKSYAIGLPWARKTVAALASTDFELQPGEIVALVGESGSGKTTFGRLCLGLVKPTNGRVLLDGSAFPSSRRDIRGKLGAVMQNPTASLNPRLRVLTSLCEPLRIAGGVSSAEMRDRALHMLERVGLPSDAANRFPSELSGGQRQRVTIARALMTSPRLIVFDEAISALDVSVQAQVLNLIRDLQAELGFASLFITHDLAAARYLAHRVLVMYRGAVISSVTATRLYQPIEQPYLRQLLIASGLVEPSEN